MFRVVVFLNRPKHFDQPKALQPNNSSGSGNKNLRNCFESRPVRIDFPIRFQPGQKMPAQSAAQFQVFKRRIPTVKTNKFRLESAIVRFNKHFRKMVVFGFAVCVFIKDSIIERNRPVAVSPQQTNQIDAENNRLVFSRPMPRTKSVVCGKRFIKSRIIQNQNACFFVNLCLSLLPMCFGIRLKPLKQSSKSIVCRSVLALSSAREQLLLPSTVLAWQSQN